MRRNTSLLGILLVLCSCFFATRALTFILVPSNGYTFSALNCGTKNNDNLIFTDGESTVNLSSDPVVASGFYIVTESNANHVLCNFAVLNAAGHSQYTLTITASFASSSTTVTRLVNVQLSNQPPTFGSIPNPVALYTDYFETTPSIPVLAVPVTDDNGFDLAIQGETGPFSLDTTSIKLISSVADRSGTRFELVLRATDRATSPMSSSVTVTFTFATRPAIVEPRDGSNLTICEVDPVGTQVYTLTVSGEGTVGVNVATGPNVFEVSNNILKLKAPATGTLLSSIDYETVKNSLPFKVELSISTSTVTVNIYVEDHNDNTPTFSGIPYSVAILETTNAGSSIFKVSATDADGSSPNNVVTLQLSGTGNEKFELNANGELKTKSTLNYAEKSVYNLVVTAMDGAAAPDTKSSSVTVTVSIETAPRFTVLNTNTTVAVAEDHDTATPIYSVAVSDPDNNAVLQYSIVSQSPGQQFSLDGNKLLSSARLDAETTASYQFVFKVSDGKYNAMSKTLTITVTDVNDVAPVFTAKPPFAVAIIESTPIGSSIFKVSATDADVSSPNNVVTLQLSGTGNEKFELNANGELKTKSTLNYAEKSVYNLVVTAMDGAAAPDTKSSSVTVTVSIETAPRFTVLNTNTTVAVAEDYDTATPIYSVAVSDPDNNAVLQYSIVSQSPGQQFSLDGNKLLSSARLDAETTASYQFVFKVSDGKYNAMSKTLTITITDVNDVVPVFTAKPPFAVAIIESTPIGTMVMNMSAKDGDLTSPNNVVTYSFTGSADKFSIDPILGVVTTKAKLNYTEKSSYILTVAATDEATDLLKRKTATGVLTISLKTAPHFTVLYTKTTVTVAENHNTAIPIYTVAVSDPDNNAVLQYSIVSQSPGTQFSLDGNKLLSSARLDAETTASYQFVFNVSDGQNWIISETLKIDVTDVNDNAPQFGELVLSGFIDTASVGSILFTAQATDADKTSPNNLVTYSLSGNNVDYFSIDAASGKVTLSRAFNISNVSNFQFNVVASDGATGAAKKTTTKAVSFKVIPEPESRSHNGTNATVGLNERQVKNIRLNGTSPGNLYRLDVYQQKTNQIKAAWDKMAGTSQTEHVVSNIRPGSIIHDVLFITNNLSSVQDNLQYLYTGGTMKLGNETVSVLSLQIGNVSYSNSQPDRATLLCGLHEAIQPCGPSGKCEVKSGRAYCREIADDNFAIIIGVLAGILAILFFILLGAIVMFITKRSRSKEISRSSERSGKSHSYSDRSHHSREFSDMAGSKRAIRSGRNLYSNGDPTAGVYPPYTY